MEYFDLHERRAAILAFTYENPQSARVIAETLGMDIRDVSNDLTMLNRQDRIFKDGSAEVVTKGDRVRTVPAWKSIKKYTVQELESEMFARRPPEAPNVPDYPPSILFAFGYNTLPEPKGRKVDNSHVRPLCSVSKQRVAIPSMWGMFDSVSA